jgi:hypothetical protein
MIVFPYFITLSSNHKILQLTHLSAIHHSNMSNEIDQEENLPRRVAYRVRKSSGGDYYDDEGYGEFDKRRGSVGYKRRKRLEGNKDETMEDDGGGNMKMEKTEKKMESPDPPPNTPASDIESASPTTASSHTLGRSELDFSSPSLASSHTLGRSEMTYSSPSITSSHTLGRSELGSSSPSIASSHTLGRSEFGSPPSRTWDTSLSGVHCGEISSSSEGSEFESESEGGDEGDLFREMYSLGSGVKETGMMMADLMEG